MQFDMIFALIVWVNLPLLSESGNVFFTASKFIGPLEYQMSKKH